MCVCVCVREYVYYYNYVVSRGPNENDGFRHSEYQMIDRYRLLCFNDFDGGFSIKLVKMH